MQMAGAGVRRVLGARDAPQRYLAYTEIFSPGERARLMNDGLQSRSRGALAEHDGLAFRHEPQG